MSVYVQSDVDDRLKMILRALLIGVGLLTVKVPDTVAVELLVLCLANVVAKCHILGWGHTQGAMTPKFELGRDFCTMNLPPNFIIPCLLVRKLSC